MGLRSACFKNTLRSGYKVLSFAKYINAKIQDLFNSKFCEKKLTKVVEGGVWVKNSLECIDKRNSKITKLVCFIAMYPIFYTSCDGEVEHRDHDSIIIESHNNNEYPLLYTAWIEPCSKSARNHILSFGL